MTGGVSRATLGRNSGGAMRIVRAIADDQRGVLSVSILTGKVSRVDGVTLSIPRIAGA